LLVVSLARALTQNLDFSFFVDADFDATRSELASAALEIIRNSRDE
jgi:hypothetical protein